MQILKLISSILTIYTVAASSPTCGKSAVTGIFSRVIGGKDAPKGAWPWQALLIRTSLYLPSRIRSRNAVGGGSVINSKWVLSAAHIFDDPNLLRSLATQNWKGFLVVLGMHEYPERLDPLEEGSIVFEPIEVIIHENYDSATYDRDIALIKFGKVFKEQNRRFIEDKTVTDIPLDGSIRAVCLPCYNACDGSEDERKGSSCSKYAESTASGHKSPVTVTGFGSIVARDPMSYSFKYPSKLQQADLKLLNGTECQTGITNVNSIYKKAGHNLKAQYTDHMLCAIGKSKSGNVSDSCQGDSGGPLVTQVGSPSGGVCWIQVGIVSWGLGCATESDRGLIPGYYTNVASQIQWILGKIEQGFSQGVVERKQGVVEGESRGPPIQRALNIKCPTLEPPENGVINGPNDNFDIGSIVEYSCDKGYAVKDKNVLKCLPEGKWDQVPMCEEQCKLHAKFSNGKFTKFDMPNAKLLVFQCNNGFKMNGKNVAICNYALDAIWEKFPTCDATSCPPPSPIDNGKVTKSSNEIGGKAKFECNKGYKIVGTYHSVCGKDGNWTPHPKCEEILCTEPETPINGAVSILDSYKIGSEVTFACSDGFKLEGQRVSTCSSEGRWTGNKRICKEMRCPAPDSLSNGRVIGNKYTVRSVITFECNSGFKLDGKSSSTCNTNEEWDIFPRCRVDTSCNVEPPKNGGIYNPKEEYTSGSFIFYYCNTGYDLTGPKYTLCFQSKLNPQPPKCIERN